MNHEPTLAKVQLTEGLGLANEAQPPPEPAGFRTRYRSEPGMIGHYPWTYADQGRRRIERPSCEYEDLFTADQVRAVVAAERERMCVAIKAADDTASEADYMLDSDDCISVIRGTWALKA